MNPKEDLSNAGILGNPAFPEGQVIFDGDVRRGFLTYPCQEFLLFRCGHTVRDSPARFFLLALCFQRSVREAPIPNLENRLPVAEMFLGSDRNRPR